MGYGRWGVAGGGKWKVEGLGKGNGSGKPAKRRGLVALRMSHPLGQDGRMVERRKIVLLSHEFRMVVEKTGARRVIR